MLRVTALLLCSALAPGHEPGPDLRALSSRVWASWLSERRIDAQDLCFLIGGPEGLSSRTMALADERLSLGPQTMAHQLARVVLLEQLFRATKILAREPYHC